MAKTNKPVKEESQSFKKALELISKEYGKEAIRKLSDAPVVAKDAISTGSFTLDLALGIGGLPRGRIIEIFGPESSGKTTLALHAVASVQNAGGVVAYVDAENALDPAWASKIGVNIDDLFVNQPDSAEQGLAITDILGRGGCDLVVVDSVAALVPRAELEGEIGDSHVGLQARLMSQTMRKLVGNINKSKTTIIFINQIREKIGVMFGNPEVTPGGRALKFYASVRLDVRRKATVKDGEVPVGAQVTTKVVKNKVAPPFKQSDDTLFFGNPVSGFDYAASLIKPAIDHKIISVSGSWHNYGSTRLGNGLKATQDFLRSNKDLMEEIKSKIVSKYTVVETSIPDEITVKAVVSDKIPDDLNDGIESLADDTEQDDVPEEK